MTALIKHTKFPKTVVKQVQMSKMSLSRCFFGYPFQRPWTVRHYDYAAGSAADAGHRPTVGGHVIKSPIL